MEIINDIQNKFHHISQFLGGFGKSYLPEKEDQSHTAMMWDIGKSALVTQTFRKVHIELSYQDIDLKIFCGDATYELDLLGVNYEIIENWIKESMEDFGLDPDVYAPHAGFALKTPFDGFIAIDNEEEKAILTAIEHRNIAQKCLQDISLSFPKTTKIWVWPHDFDTGMLIGMGENSSFDTKVIGCGYAIADDVYETPYYYVYAWSKAHDISYAQLPDLKYGTWLINTHWKGILLPSGTSDNVTVKTVTSFFEEAIDALSKLL